MILSITSEEKERCFAFADKIIRGGNQFNRFQQNIETQIIRTYIGKLAEYVFFHFLESRNIKTEEGDMFEIFEGEENADAYDFLLPNGKSVDIKTASLPFHSRIMIPITQFHLRKDYYVGIKLNFQLENEKVKPHKIENCIIHGFVEREKMEEQPTQNFGEGNCKSYPLNQMRNIEELILMYNEFRGI